jgi:hypothetical protein
LPIVAIVAVNVLDWFMHIERSTDNLKLGWLQAFRRTIKPDRTALMSEKI